jgi:cobyrinic acid a,c-diamide synthase
MMDPITRTDVIAKLSDYFDHRITLAALVDWAEEAMQEGAFADPDAGLLRDVVARLGVADVRAFGLTWEDCEELVRRLGFRAEIKLRPSTRAGAHTPSH